MRRNQKYKARRRWRIALRAEQAFTNAPREYRGAHVTHFVHDEMLIYTEDDVALLEQLRMNLLKGAAFLKSATVSCSALSLVRR